MSDTKLIYPNTCISFQKMINHIKYLFDYLVSLNANFSGLCDFKNDSYYIEVKQLWCVVVTRLMIGY